jgi:hypothetical protein
MNRREKKELCELIAGREWSQGGSSSEAAATGMFARELLEIFNLKDDDPVLREARCWEIMQSVRYKREGNAVSKNYSQTSPWVPELVDVEYAVAFWAMICDDYEELGYEGLVDKIEEDLKGLCEEWRARALKEYREDFGRDPRDL